MSNNANKFDSLCCPNCEAGEKDCTCPPDTEKPRNREPTYEKTLNKFNEFYVNHSYTQRLDAPLNFENLPRAFSAHAFWWQQEKIYALENEIEFLRIFGNKDCTAMADDAIKEYNKGKK